MVSHLQNWASPRIKAATTWSTGTYCINCLPTIEVMCQRCLLCLPTLLQLRTQSGLWLQRSADSCRLVSQQKAHRDNGIASRTRKMARSAHNIRNQDVLHNLFAHGHVVYTPSWTVGNRVVDCYDDRYIAVLFCNLKTFCLRSTDWFYCLWCATVC